MAENLVLITGATGHLGFKVLRTALEASYHVRAAVRSEQKAAILKSNPVLKATAGLSNLSFIVVPDFLVPGAFDEAVKDIKYIIHVASPIVTKVPEGDDFDAHFVQPAVQGTLGLFESARKSATVTRIVVTSSVVAILPLSAFAGSDGLTYSAESRLPEIEPPFDNGRVGYVASKIAALNRAEAWIEKEKPSFDVIHIHPSYIFGRDDLADSTEYFQTGTNRVPLNIALGVTTDPLPNTWNDVTDTAKIHVMSLDPKVPGNQSFLASSNGQDGMTWVPNPRMRYDGETANMS
jgi:nucleoside-diphosphate-sugar epimerase